MTGFCTINVVNVPVTPLTVSISHYYSSQISELPRQDVYLLAAKLQLPLCV